MNVASKSRTGRRIYIEYPIKEDNGIKKRKRNIGPSL